MLSPTIKQRVRESFDRAATTYNGAAILQRHVCDQLLAGLSGIFAAPPPSAVLDAGCGTGYGARQIRTTWPNTRITGVDFAPAMLDLARFETDACQVADIESLPFGNERFDLWWSSLSIQWCDPTIVFTEAFRVLSPRGRLAVSTLGPDTFHELRTAFHGVDTHRHTLEFDTPESIRTALVQAGFATTDIRREHKAIYYPDLKTLLRAVKDIGAHNVGDGGRSGMMGRSAWKQIEAAYERFRTPEGLPASYDIIYAYASK